MVAEQEPVQDEYGETEEQERRAERRRGVVLRRDLLCRVEHLRCEHVDVVRAAEQQGPGELAQPEQEADAGAVDERRAQQREGHAEEDTDRR